MKGKLFWVVIAVLSVAAAIFGYQRFKKIRPDLFEQPTTSATTESERAARIAEYQQKGDALTRAAVPATSRKLQSGEACQNGFVVRWEKRKKESDFLVPFQVIENGQPVRCDVSAPLAPR
jgi:hypothetical protein